MSLSKPTAKKIIATCVKASTVEDVRVSISSSRRGNLRFANNEPTSEGDAETISVSVTAVIEGRSATVRSNRTDPTSLEALVKDAEDLAGIAPKDPEAMPPLGKASFQAVRAADTATAKLTAKRRVALAKTVMDAAKARGLDSAGFLDHSHASLSLGNKAGLFAHHEATSLSLSSTFRTADGKGSGRAAQTSHRVQDIDPETLAQRAAEKAEMSAGAQRLDPGRYTVILEPQAVADLLSFFLGSLGARPAEEGRSYFSRDSGSAIGETLFDKRITMESDPRRTDHPSRPFSGDGQPLVRTMWVREGKLINLTRSRYWAKTSGKDPVPSPGSLFMAGTDQSILELVKGVDRGVWVTRFWYNRMLEPQSILATGLTRDGTFFVEDGRVSAPIKNFRYNDSPITLLKNVVALGKPERVEGGRFPMVVPPMVVSGFNFSSVSDAV